MEECLSSVFVNASQLLPAWIANNTLNQKAVAKAKFALHLAAADEHRVDPNVA